MVQFGERYIDNETLFALISFFFNLQWLACVPLLFFGVISIDDKKHLSRKDFVIILSSFLAIAFGFSLNLSESILYGSFAISCSTIFAMIMLFYVSQLQPRVKYEIVGGLDTTADMDLHHEIQSRKKNLVNVLLFLIPTFPIIYLLAVFKILTKDETKVAFAVCNMSTKILYTVILMLSQSESVRQLLVAERSANTARRNFLRYVMHEVRVPLNSVTAGIGVLDIHSISEEEKDTLQMMKAATSYMSSTLNNILSMQKIEEGKFILTMKPFFIHDLIKCVLMTMRCMFIEKNIHLVSNVEENVPCYVLGDRYRLEHVLANLLSNAVKFSPINGNIFISVSYSTVSFGKKPILTFSVKDEGVGMTADDMKLLFQPFTQLNAHEMQKGGGTGVGLSICKQIIELHGGTLYVQSKVKSGSIFSFEIPCHVQPMSEDSTSGYIPQISSRHTSANSAVALSTMLTGTAAMEATMRKEQHLDLENHAENPNLESQKTRTLTIDTTFETLVEPDILSAPTTTNTNILKRYSTSDLLVNSATKLTVLVVDG